MGGQVAVYAADRDQSPLVYLATVADFESAGYNLYKATYERFALIMVEQRSRISCGPVQPPTEIPAVDIPAAQTQDTTFPNIFITPQNPTSGDSLFSDAEDGIVG